MNHFLLISSLFCALALNPQNTVKQFYQISRGSETQNLPIESHLAPFYHGVASGDPLSDAVIIWTRITLDSTVTSAKVNYTVATDLEMENIVEQGVVETSSAQDYTIKVDVQQLNPFTYYYYQFEYQGAKSIIGRTKTAPVGQQDFVKIGVVSCVNYQAGYFNGYGRLAAKDGYDVILNLGDYLYEYAEGGYGYSEEVGRGHEPDHEMVSLDDYRLRHSFYKLDKDLRRAHQLFPFICVWDDHESTNDSYKDGAENHQEDSEGDWETRKLNAATAYQEWLPIRTPDINDPVKLWRQFSYGDLVDLIMLDTRIYGREQQLESTDDPAYNDPNRTMLGIEQYNWMTEALLNSTAQYKVLGQQVMMTQFHSGPNQPFNLDAWDGYPAERDKVLNFVADNNIENFVVLTGDIHTTWASDLTVAPQNPLIYNSATGAGSVGCEFVTPSITSDNFNEITGTPAGSSESVEQAVLGYNRQIKYVELDDHGYMQVSFSPTQVQADWFTTAILSPDTNETYLKSYSMLDGARHITEQNAPIDSIGFTAPAPPTAEQFTGIHKIASNSVLSMYPNPASDYLYLQYANHLSGAVSIQIMQLDGRIVEHVLVDEAQPSGVFDLVIDVQNLATGSYLLQLQHGQQQRAFPFVKQ